jgi:hypothetical protein
MISAILLTISTVTLGQFVLHYWRAMVYGVAAHSISDRVRTAAGISGSLAGARDFRSILSLHDLAPGLSGPSRGFRVIRAYYAAVEKIGRLIPSMTNWAN